MAFGCIRVSLLGDMARGCGFRRVIIVDGGGPARKKEGKERGEETRVEKTGIGVLYTHSWLVNE